MTEEIQSSRHLVIDAEELASALEGGGDEIEYYLDRKTGEVILHSEDLFADTDEEFGELLERHPERFLYIEPLPSWSGYQTMTDFIEQMPPSEARDRLARSITHGKPFRHFKDTLLDYPDLRENWFAFHRRVMLDHARKWVQSAALDADLKIPT